LGLFERARAAIGAPLRLRLLGGLAVAGRLQRVGPDWWLLEDDGGRETVVATAALAGVRGFGRYAAAPGTASILAARIGLRPVLRAVARDRSAVALHLRDGTSVSATIDRVGAEFVDVAVHPQGGPGRREEGRGGLLLAVRSRA